MTRLKFISVVLLSIVFASSAVSGDETGPELPAKKDDFLIFLLAGQSNMAGRGEVTEEDLAAHPRVLALARDGTWKPAVDPIHYDKKIAGTGLAKSFALTLAELDASATIGLVPAACGGSPISAWEPGAYFEPTDSHPYDDAIARARRAMEDGTLNGILWHQGEADARRDTGPAYKDKLIALAERFRKDLDAEDAPFIIGQLGHFEGQPWTDAKHGINKAQAAAAQEIPYAGFVSSFSLTAKEDNVHFNSESLREFGKRYARAYLNVVRDKIEAEAGTSVKEPADQDNPASNRKNKR